MVLVLCLTFVLMLNVHPLFLVRLLTFYNSGNPGTRRLYTDFELSASQNMRAWQNFEKNTWNRLIFRYKHMKYITFSVFIIPKRVFCISTTTICLPSQIWIVFEIHTEMLGASELIYADSPRQSSTLHIRCRPTIFYVLHNRDIKIESDGFIFNS